MLRVSAVALCVIIKAHVLQSHISPNPQSSFSLPCINLSQIGCIVKHCSCCQANPSHSISVCNSAPWSVIGNYSQFRWWSTDYICSRGNKNHSNISAHIARFAVIFHLPWPKTSMMGLIIQCNWMNNTTPINITVRHYYNQPRTKYSKWGHEIRQLKELWTWMRTDSQWGSAEGGRKARTSYSPSGSWLVHIPRPTTSTQLPLNHNAWLN